MTKTVNIVIAEKERERERRRGKERLVKLVASKALDAPRGRKP